MNKNFAALLLVVFSFFFSFESMSQATSAIGGVVVNKNSQVGLPGISIQLTPGGKSTVSDSSGNFRIAGIIPGAYAISFSGVGFLILTAD